jgi:hypothetical protein
MSVEPAGTKIFENKFLEIEIFDPQEESDNDNNSMNDS